MGTVSKYSVVTLVFFTTYIVFQPPATVIVRYLGPRVFLSFIVVAWGAVMIGMGFSDSFGTLAALRVVLGILEAGFFPSCVYLLSTWYTRFDIGKRYSVFYILGSLASACAGILAYGLMQLKGREGLNGWRQVIYLQTLCEMIADSLLDGSSLLKELSLASWALSGIGLSSTFRTRPTHPGTSSTSAKRDSSSSVSTRIVAMRDRSRSTGRNSCVAVLTSRSGASRW